MGGTDAKYGSDEARQQLYEVMGADIEFREKAARALDLGRSYLGVDNGHLTRIDSTANFWEAIASTDTADGSFPPGLTLDLQSTYCRRTVQGESTVSVHDAPNQGWAGDPAFETHGLHCYHGVPVIAGDTVYGTVCFVSDAPRSDPFTDEESMFAELIGHLLGHAIERERYEIELNEREEMVDVLCRVLRHNLRNGLTVVRGHSEYIRAQLSNDTTTHIDTMLATIDELLELGDRTQQLSTLMAESLDRSEADIEALVEGCVREVAEAHPNAAVTIDGGIESPVPVSPQIETAVQELIENAVKHSGDSPSVVVSLAETPESVHIQISDDGPGIPENERAVLQAGRETPLKHGRGLGLWIVYWIITRHDGDIETAVSETGSTVTVTLPRVPSKIPVTDG